jgi:Ca-activated chloride channel family protein
MKFNLFYSWLQLKSVFSYSWENEFYLYLIPLPLLIILIRLLVKRKNQARVVLSFNAPLKQHKFTRFLTFLPDTILSLCMVALILALADPYKTIYHTRVQQEGVDIAMGIDISSSMLSKDVLPTRLAVAKQTASAFISGRKYDQIALVAFAGAPYLASPITSDSSFLSHALRTLSNQQISEEGTALGDALGMCINQIREEANPKKIIILISDGNNTAGNLDPLTSAELAKTFKIKVYTIAVGSLNTTLDPVDESTLRMIAKQSNGRFYRATDQQTLRLIFQEIDVMEKSRKLIIREVEHQSAAQVFYQLAFILFFINLFLKIIGVSNSLED